MPAKVFRRAAATILPAILVLVVVGGVLTRYWISPPVTEKVPKKKSSAVELVDQQPLITAQRLAALATTPEEQEFARNAVRLADLEVDMAFAAALHNATEHPAPIPAAALPIQARVQELQTGVQKTQKSIAGLKQQLAKSDDAHKETLEGEEQLQEARLEVEQEELDLARQELIRAGGDPRSRIQQLVEQHEAVGHGQMGANANRVEASARAEESRTLLVQFRAWRQEVAKHKELNGAREELSALEVDLAHKHQLLDAQTRAEHSKEQQSQTAPETAGGTAGQQPAGGANPPAGQQASPDVATLKQIAGERRHLAELDKRAADLQEIDGLYKQWSQLVEGREQERKSALLEGGLWVLALLLLVVFANRLVRSVVARLAPESRRRHTAHTIARFVLQVSGVALILLVMFGPPSQLATVVAFTGAGLTVALKDFIVGFFGWFILMGPNGIRPGDWVEINGVGGEVINVGLLHTVILETGNWSDAGHPTGRKVTFVNSFAIEGHYFNFSTAGQWLWDELEVPVPAGVDPYPIAEAVQKAVLKATQSSMREAEQEWQRAVSGHVGRTFSPVPAVSVRPTTLGVSVVVRYITRANERHEVRTRLFQAVVDLLRSAQISPAPQEGQGKTVATAG